MAHSIDFMKTGCTSKISQISEFQNHLPKKLKFNFSIKHPKQIKKKKKKQFAMTDPVEQTIQNQMKFQHRHGILP